MLVKPAARNWRAYIEDHYDWPDSNNGEPCGPSAPCPCALAAPRASAACMHCQCAQPLLLGGRVAPPQTHHPCLPITHTRRRLPGSGAVRQAQVAGGPAHAVRRFGAVAGQGRPALHERWARARWVCAACWPAQGGALIAWAQHGLAQQQTAMQPAAFHAAMSKVSQDEHLAAQCSSTTYWLTCLPLPLLTPPPCSRVQGRPGGQPGCVDQH